MNYLPIVSLTLLVVGLSSANAADDELHKRTRFMMDTCCIIQAVGPQVATLAAMDAALDRMAEINEKFHAARPSSPLFAFNETQTPVTDDEIIRLIKTAMSVSEGSKGAFDITVMPLIELWGFYGAEPHVPTKEKLQEALARVGYQHLQIADGRLTCDRPGVKVELGGIAKGYAVAEAVRVLREKGIKTALVDAGGDLYAMGKIDGELWKVGIKHPKGEGVIAGIELTDLAVVTSGDYERCFEEDGVRYHHLLNPRTGQPARGLCSVTVFSRDAVLADAWSTALFIMGPEAALKCANEVVEIEAVLVTDEGAVMTSTGLAGAIEIERLPSKQEK